MQCLIYLSSGSSWLTPSDLGLILEQARRNNAREGVTGLLLHADGNFLQVLEGDASVVEGLYKIILEDPRHFGVIKLVQYEIEARQFPKWTMALRRLRDLGVEDQARFSENLTKWKASPFTEDASVEVKALVESFIRDR
jgi:hypothetical protein